ncbi:glycine oxidase ThiO [Corallococcus sicarius]|uniref:Glycine oxidase ThiO n=1 Tax=Corallococcus sicarius TaxID=2316726 RepID=A0A3A8N8G0_9BACT|nr:glycine oxidase ThiO [Corallococcus sicarius]RKH37415.1 glycine oxidase ThiO [Corallococcus sicarius]
MGTSDVLVVGGGVMGCGIALRLRQAGARVTVLERSIPGAEASSAAAGILAPQWESEGPGPFFELCLRSRALYGQFATELRELSGVDIAYRPCGLLRVAFDEADHHHVESTVGWQHGMGLRAVLLDGKGARELEPRLSPEAVGAAHFPDDHQVDNRLLVRALTMAAARVGATFRSGYVRGIVHEQGRAVGVDLDGEVLRADAVVLAAGSWSSLVQGSGVAAQAVRPARGQMVQLQTRLPLLERIVTSAKGYLVPRADGRVIAGSTMEHVGYDKQVTAAGLARILDMALQLCPELGSAPVMETWAGFRPWTQDALPYIGAGPVPGLFLATGHFRNGILLTPITAKLVAQAVLGEKPSVDLTPFRYDRGAMARG